MKTQNNNQNELEKRLEEISQEYLHQETSNWSKIKRYDKLDKLENKKAYIKKLREGYYDCSPDYVEELLKLMPIKYKQSIKYTLLVDELFISLKNDITGNRSWQPMKADVMQNLLIHHPDKKITLTGLECLVANNVGSGTNKDIRSRICHEIGECKYIFTEYYNAQDTEGYWEYSKNCLIHSDKIYKDKESRMELWNKWNEVINNYCNNS